MSLIPYPQTRTRRIQSLPVSPSVEALQSMADVLKTLPEGSNVTLFGGLDGAIPACFAYDLKAYKLEVVTKNPSDTLRWVASRFANLSLVAEPSARPDAVIIDSVMEGTAVEDAKQALALCPQLIILHNARPRIAGNITCLEEGPKAAEVLGASGAYTNRLTYTLSTEGGRRGILWLNRKEDAASTVSTVEPDAPEEESFPEPVLENESGEPDAPEEASFPEPVLEDGSFPEPVLEEESVEPVLEEESFPEPVLEDESGEPDAPEVDVAQAPEEQTGVEPQSKQSRKKKSGEDNDVGSKSSKSRKKKKTDA